MSGSQDAGGRRRRDGIGRRAGNWTPPTRPAERLPRASDAARPQLAFDVPGRDPPAACRAQRARARICLHHRAVPPAGAADPPAQGAQPEPPARRRHRQVQSQCIHRPRQRGGEPRARGIHVLARVADIQHARRARGRLQGPEPGDATAHRRQRHPARPGGAVASRRREHAQAAGRADHIAAQGRTAQRDSLRKGQASAVPHRRLQCLEPRSQSARAAQHGFAARQRVAALALDRQDEPRSREAERGQHVLRGPQDAPRAGRSRAGRPPDRISVGGAVGLGKRAGERDVPHDGEESRDWVDVEHVAEPESEWLIVSDAEDKD